MEQSKKTNIGLVEYCEKQIGRPYWYGTFGQRATAALLANRKKTYPRYYTASNFTQQYGFKVHDCVGLIKGYFWTKDADSTEYDYQSNGMKDVSADMLFNIATKKGTNIDEMPRIPGVAVFMAGHVGVYAGGCWVIEARGHAYGVVKTKLCQRAWKKWALIPGLEYLSNSIGQ